MLFLWLSVLFSVALGSANLCEEVSLRTDKQVYRTGEDIEIRCTGCPPLKATAEETPTGAKIQRFQSSVENRNWNDEPFIIRWNKWVNEPGEVLITCLSRNIKAKQLTVNVYGGSRIIE